ncbi:transporter substrate-binding domain-containing protein [Curvibacter sp. RS43]|uniref:substrate-binding periplasmic protein n=1 Tax=Curvibacter microcysteis TaxID=3026419 RepID=UPI002361302E|nr:transporter substrate-binding domain-containing protein [Curvibacter sp. RS43]MDD0811330.1 transporter substrate-binding domain-containing protein [Curvibacter sp. RS43]
MSAPQAAEVVRMGVLGHVPPMSYRNAQGEFVGYSVDMARAVCQDLGWTCQWVPTSLATVADELKQGQLDVAAMSLLSTPERRSHMLFARPYYTSISAWVARPGVALEAPGTRVAVVQGSAQARFAQSRQWTLVEVKTHTELAQQLAQGRVDGLLAPMMTVVGLMAAQPLQSLQLQVQPRRDPELTGAASFGISPMRPELKPLIDGALERLERNGVYDKINSRYLPFKVN